MTGPLPFTALVGAVSARTPLGLTARQTTFCARARKGEPRSTRFRNRLDRSIGACTTPGLSDGLEGIDRMIALAAPALAAVAASARSHGVSPIARGAGSGAGAGATGAPEESRSPWPLLLAVPEPGRPDDDARFGGGVLAELAARAGVAIDEARSSTFREGHAGFAHALAAAVELLSRGAGAGAGAAIVGAVDSYFHAGVLAWLDAEARVHGLGVENGFVPGEGAAFLVLSRSASPRGAASPRSGAGAQVRLRAVETGVETSVETGAPNIGQTSSRLVAAIAQLDTPATIRWALTDVNGERHRVREWTQVAMRGSIAEGAKVDRFAEDLGDCGAASGAVLAVIAHELLVTGAAPAENACIALAADGAARGAFSLGLEGSTS